MTYYISASDYNNCLNIIANYGYGNWWKLQHVIMVILK